MDYMTKLKNKFLQYHNSSNRDGVIVKIFLGDNNLVAELRKSKHRYLVSVYKYRNGVFNRLFQERFKSRNSALLRLNEIQGEF